MVRRSLVCHVLAGLLFPALLLPLLSAQAPQGKKSAETAGTAPAKLLTAGFIYVGPKDDYGYNQASAQGAAAVKKMKNVKVVEQENVPETIAVQRCMKAMIEKDGARVIFPTSFGYFAPHVLKLAKEYPEVMFLHLGGLWDAKRHPPNVGSYFGYTDECEYLSGIVAAHASKSRKLGFVAAKPIPQLLRDINAFTLGARSVDPTVTCAVIFTGDWSIPAREAEAANTLIDEGVDVLTCHVDSPKVVIETAEKRGIYSCGYHVSQARLAPKGYLTGAEWNWEKVYTHYVEAIRQGKKVPNLVRGGLKEGTAKMSPYGPAVSVKARLAADAVKAKFMAGSLAIFKGPLRDNQGRLVIPADIAYSQTAVELEGMSYLVEGVLGRR